MATREAEAEAVAVANVRAERIMRSACPRCKAPINSGGHDLRFELVGEGSDFTYKQWHLVDFVCKLNRSTKLRS